MCIIYSIGSGSGSATSCQWAAAAAAGQWQFILSYLVLGILVDGTTNSEQRTANSTRSTQRESVWRHTSRRAGPWSVRPPAAVNALVPARVVQAATATRPATRLPFNSVRCVVPRLVNVASSILTFSTRAYTCGSGSALRPARSAIHAPPGITAVQPGSPWLVTSRSSL
jgi:hypothetical protein